MTALPNIDNATGARKGARWHVVVNAVLALGRQSGYAGLPRRAEL